MLAADLINYDIPTLKPSDKVGRAIALMHDNHVGQLAVVENEQYLGMVEEDLLLGEEEKTKLSDIFIDYSTVFVSADQHLYEILGIITRHQLQTVAVLNNKHEYIGAIKATDSYKQFAELLGTYEQGAILEIQIKNRDYSLSEISRLIEAENTKVTGFYVSGSTTDYENPLRLTIKLNRENVTTIIATLERFGYIVEATYATSTQYHHQDRFDLLMKYLDI